MTIGIAKLFPRTPVPRDVEWLVYENNSRTVKLGNLVYGITVFVVIIFYFFLSFSFFLKSHKELEQNKSY